MKRILSGREKIILYITVGVVLFSAVFNIFLLPVLDKNARLNQKINSTTEKLKKYAQLMLEKERIEAEYGRFAATSGVSREADTSVSALTELENLANSAQIRIIDIRPSSAKIQKAKGLIIETRLEGTMDQFMKFIYNIEQSISLLAIKKFQLNAKPNSAVLEGVFSIAEFSLPGS